ncbi:uncharacterized protein LOC110176058 [Drosophila serrata]|uniref:uncharacterized protein LOC110176058 n=1 Tax=Drosophila serrata TaxID=7274 RepID=UPI000A1D062C|nr:uncharacterized protein LOC110176058 [Drosophila serrata]
MRYRCLEKIRMQDIPLLNILLSFHRLLMAPMRICEQLAASSHLSAPIASFTKCQNGLEGHRRDLAVTKFFVLLSWQDSPLRAKAEEYYWKRFMPTSAAQGAIRMEVSSNNNTNSNTLKLNTRTALAFLENDITTASPTGITTVTLSPAAIERDSEGRPLHRGCARRAEDPAGAAGPQVARDGAKAHAQE